MEKIKGADLVLPAFSKLLAAHPECRLKIVGDGSLCEMMQEQQKSLQIPNEKVEWLGRVNASSLPSLYRQMDIVWCPSRSEGFGLTVVEAMASGAVVVAANIGSLNEIIQTEDGAAGILLTPESHDALSDATCHLLDDEHKYRELSRKGIDRVEAFSNEKYTNNVLSLYNKL